LKYEKRRNSGRRLRRNSAGRGSRSGEYEYQLHFRRASFNASQAFMQQGRALAEQRDYVGAYKRFFARHTGMIR